MRVTKAERDQIKHRFGGRCAYCGSELGAQWHVDHLQPVFRRPEIGSALYPDRHALQNFMPACVSCNISKATWTLESWREKLEDATGVLTRNSPTYRHAIRFGLLVETKINVSFYFERCAEKAAASPALPTDLIQEHAR